MIAHSNDHSVLGISNTERMVAWKNVSRPASVISPVTIRVWLTPESGDAITVDAQIDSTVNNPATVDVPVTLPINTGVNVMVYTR